MSILLRPTQNDLEFILDQLRCNPQSKFIDQIVLTLGFDSNVVSELRDNVSGCDNIDDLRCKFDIFRFHAIVDYCDREAKNIKNTIVETGDLPLSLRSLIASDSVIFTKLKMKWFWEFPKIETIDQLLDKFRKTRYTRTHGLTYLSPIECLEGAAYYGHKDMAKKALNILQHWENVDYNKPMIKAASSGRIDMCKFVLKRAPLFGVKTSSILRAAAENGQIEFLKWFLSLEWVNPDVQTLQIATVAAIKNDKIDVVMYFIETGLIVANNLARLALVHCRTYVTKFLFEKGLISPDYLLERASRYDDREMMQLALEKGVTNINTVTEESIHQFYTIESIIFLLNWGANDYNTFMVKAAQLRGSTGEELVNLMIFKGANDFNRVVLELIGNNNNNEFMLRKMFECGADNYDEAITLAEERNVGNVLTDTINYIKQLKTELTNC